MQPAEDSGARDPQEGERLPELTLRLMRTRGLWHIPDLDARSALDILAQQPPGSFLVTGFGLSLALTVSTAPHPEALGTFRILESSAGVTLQGSRLSFPDLPALLAFLSTSRDVLPQPLLLPPGSLGPGAPAPGESPPSRGARPPAPPSALAPPPEPLQTGTVRITRSRGALSVVNPLYLRCHEPGGVGEKNPETVQRDSLAPQPVGSHRVSWIEGAPCPEPEPEVCSLHSLEEGEDGLVEDRLRGAEEAGEEGEDDAEPTDGVYHRVQALAQARGSLVAKGLRALQARLREAQGGPRGPEAGDPATELLQDVHRLLADLKEQLVDDPEVQAAHRAWTAPRTRPHEELEAMVEAAVCWVLLRPLQPVLWTKLRILRARDLQQLQWRQEVMRAWALQEGPRPEAPGPSPTRRRIHARLARLHAARAPQRKVSILLAVCRDVYAGLARTGGQGKRGCAASRLGGAQLPVSPALPPRRAPGGRRLPAGPDRGAPVESGHRGHPAGRGVPDGDPGPRGAPGGDRLLPHLLVRGPPPHRPLPASGVRAGPEGPQLRGQGLHPPLAAPAHSARLGPHRAQPIQATRETLGQSGRGQGRSRDRPAVRGGCSLCHRRPVTQDVRASDRNSERPLAPAFPAPNKST
ncbi:ras and Rab interactor-like protein isoform X2 [Antechinus flavipes]|uniref:ras and Rab interactor-like protein isoform X2 n=1 Tax=Antechinus flavipes TaxID=38775 RepID=UPI0022357CB1|nr:ras and Rab interactor-like protein isoform X2 [Antechinus flavipes]